MYKYYYNYLCHLMDEQQREGDVSDVAAEADLENVAARNDDGMSRCQVRRRGAHRVISDEMKHYVNFRQV